MTQTYARTTLTAMITLMLKIRMAIFLVIVAALFGLLGWMLVDSTQPRAAISVLLSDKPFLVLATAVVFALVITGVARCVGGPHAHYFALLAAPAGLAVWAFRSTGADALLLAWPQVAQRARMYSLMAGDTLIWAVIVALSYLLAFVLFRRHARTHSLEATARTRRSGSLSRAGLTAVGTSLAAAAFAGILVRILAASCHTWVEEGLATRLMVLAPAKNQAILAIALAFFLVTILFNRVAGARLESLLAAPVVLALATYLWAASSVTSNQQVHAAQLIDPTLRPATIVPVVYIGVGMAAIVFGYAYARHNAYERANRIPAS